MKTIRDPAGSEHGVSESTGRVLGWVSGLGLLLVPVFVAGVLATAAGMAEEVLNPGLLDPERWDAERTFPWFYLAAFVAGLGWIVYGSVRIRGFVRGAVPATAITVAVIGGIFVLALIVP